MQNSRLSTSQYQTANSYLSHQGNFSDSRMNSNHSTLMTTSTSSNSDGTGYRSIIGRRRQIRYDDPNNFIDNKSIGDAYSSSVFVQSQNPYMNMFEEPPVIPPRLRRVNYRNEDINDRYRRHSTDEYLSENTNNNNNNNPTLPQETFIHYAYPATVTSTTSFRPINIDSNSQFDPYNQLSLDLEDFQDQAQSTSSTNSSDSIKQRQQRLTRLNNIQTQTNNQQRLPGSSLFERTNIQQNGRKTNEQIISNKLSSNNPPNPSSMMRSIRFISLQFRLINI